MSIASDYRSAERVKPNADWLIIGLFTASASISILAIIGAWDVAGRIASLFH